MMLLVTRTILRIGLLYASRRSSQNVRFSPRCWLGPFGMGRPAAAAAAAGAFGREELSKNEMSDTKFWAFLGIAVSALVLHSAIVSYQTSPTSSDFSWLKAGSETSRIRPSVIELFEPKRKAAHTSSLAAINAPYETRRWQRSIRSRLDSRQRAIRDTATQSWLQSNKFPTAALPPKSHVPHVMYRHNIIQPIVQINPLNKRAYTIHLPGQQNEEFGPCTSNCDWIQSRALKAAEGLVEMAKRTHDARALAAQKQQARDEKVIRSLRAKLSHILPDPTGRCLATLQCSDCEVIPQHILSTKSIQ